jgi:hypothetical protein
LRASDLSSASDLLSSSDSGSISNSSSTSNLLSASNSSRASDLVSANDSLRASQLMALDQVVKYFKKITKFYYLQTPPRCKITIFNVWWRDFKHFNGNVVVKVLAKVKNIQISKDLLEQRNLTFGILPGSIKHVYWESALE